MFELDPRTVEAQARRAAGWLRGRGLRPGDRLAVVASNRPEYATLTMGALRTGIVPVLVNVHLAPADRDWIVADCDPALVVTDQTWPSWDDDPPLELAPWPLARPMHYTSGTTGRSKGVWSGLLSEADAAAFADDEHDLWAASGPGEAVLVCSPLYHSAPHRITLSALLHGARALVQERFDAEEAAGALAGGRATGAFLVPTHLRRLVAVDGLSAPAARRVLVAGEPCPDALMRRAMRAVPVLWQFYGSTEGQFTIITPGEWAERPTSVGRARTGRIVDVRDAGSDGVGTVYVSALPFTRWEYWRSPERTAEAWDGDAFTVGDLGRIDADGYLYLEGRREDLVICGGVNVYPAEVERVLLEHPDVVEVAVYGVPDEEYGQRVCAAVVSRGASAGDIGEWARSKLPGSHRPKQVTLVDALPRTGSGKVRRTDLVWRHRPTW